MICGATAAFRCHKRYQISFVAFAISERRYCMKKTRNLVFIALLICMEVILTRFLSIQTPIVRISFGFLPIAFAAAMFGPVIGGLTAALCDILGMMIFPKGIYFPGFTLSASITGVIYGIFLYKKPKSLLRIAMSVMLVTVISDLTLNTIWLSMMTGKAAIALLAPRAVKSLLMYPVQVFVIYTAWQYAGAYIERRYLLTDTNA